MVMRSSGRIGGTSLFLVDGAAAAGAAVSACPIALQEYATALDAGSPSAARLTRAGLVVAKWVGGRARLRCQPLAQRRGAEPERAIHALDGDLATTRPRPQCVQLDAEDVGGLLRREEVFDDGCHARGLDHIREGA